MPTTAPHVPVRFLDRYPDPWGDAVMPKLLARGRELGESSVTISQERGLCEREALLRAREERWQRITGVRPADSSFTVCLPIHNEAAVLESALNVFTLSFIPESVSANVILITNACSDESGDIAARFLRSIGEVSVHTTPAALVEIDPTLKSDFEQVSVGRVNFLHLDSEIPSKANALNVGNKFSHLVGCSITMSLDTNNWIEPDSIAHLFKHAHDAIVAKNAEGALLMGWRMAVPAPTALGMGAVMKRARNRGNAIQSGPGWGWIMAWGTEFVERNGFPHTATEDYALTLEHRVRGLPTTALPEVPVWGYEVTDLGELLSLNARIMRGAIQVATRAMQEGRNDMLELLKQDGYGIRLSDRVCHLWKQICENPKSALFLISKFALIEYGFWRGARDFVRDPHSSTWEPCEHTKGVRMWGRAK